jgi:putative membrane protein
MGRHVPALFEVGMRWHMMELATFFAAGILFLWPVIRPRPAIAMWPPWSVPAYLFLAALPCDALPAFLTFCNRIVYPHYLTASQYFNLDPLEDQAHAGALMWVWVTPAYVPSAVAVTIRMLSPAEKFRRAAGLIA